MVLVEECASIDGSHGLSGCSVDTFVRQVEGGNQVPTSLLGVCECDMIAIGS